MPHLSEALSKDLRTSGRVYAVLFNNGLVKVGRSQNIRSRMRSLTARSWDKSLRLSDGWYSEDHLDWRLNELRLLVFCHEQFGDPVEGLETFNGDYPSLLTYAHTLPTSREDKSCAP